MSEASRDPLEPAVRDALHEALSGELAKEHVIAITRHHRIQGSRGYREAARYVIGKLRDFGYSTPELPDTRDGFLAAGDFDGEVSAAHRAGAAKSADAPSAWIESFT